MRISQWTHAAVVFSVAVAGYATQASADVPGTFRGTAAGASFDVEGVCQTPNDNWLVFQSDELGTRDSNGDGIVAKVVRMGEMWTLRLVKDGETIYNGAPGEFDANGGSYSLKKTLTRRKQNDTIDVDITVTCG